MFNLFGLNIHIYGLLIGLGVWAGFEIALSRQKMPAGRAVLEQILPVAVVGGIVGARLYHVIDYWDRYYSDNTLSVLFVWEGGLGIWGAIIGAGMAVYIFTKIKKMSFLKVVDDLILGVPVAQAIGRLGNFVNKELYGKNGEPLFAYEATLNLLLFGVLWRISRNNNRAGVLTGSYLMGYGFIRILLEGMRPDELIWRIGSLPVAVMFGVVSVMLGVLLIAMRKRVAR